MKAKEINFLSFLQQPKQFVIPIYQRTYSWSDKHCEQLFNDIVRCGSNENIKGHFIGAIVYVEDGLYQVSSIPKLNVIDGQQRLTTISLLLFAFAKVIDEKKINIPDITRKKINNYYHFNMNEEGSDLFFKLILTQNDKDTYLNLLKEKELSNINISKRIFNNFESFYNKLNSFDQNAINDFYKGLLKLIIVDISLDRANDNPQLIFESLNSTGLALSQADLIRNYILMRLEPEKQNLIYNNYWHPMELSFKFNEGDTSKFDDFMRDYLTTKLNRIPNQNQVYDEFKKFIIDTNDFEEIKQRVEDIYEYSKYFTKIVYAKEQDKTINTAFENINSLKVDVAYPFLIQIYKDFNKQIINKEIFLEILNTIESYVFRRAICGVPTNSLNKKFAILYKEIDKNNYLESFKAKLILMSSYKRFPTDIEFKSEFIKKDVYNFRSRNYLLNKLENYDQKEKLLLVDNVTIEHILPQNKNLSKAWQDDLGAYFNEIQEEFLHTIGNLTLTAYNSEYSDKSFKEKRDMPKGFKDSNISLNNDLKYLDKWNKEEILNRANKLSVLASKVWSYPDLSENVLSKYKVITNDKEQYSINDYKFLNGDILDLYTEINRQILNMDSNIEVRFNKYDIGYCISSDVFLKITPQKHQLKIKLDLAYNNLKDPELVTRDITNVATWGNIEFSINKINELDYAIFLIKQAYENEF